MARIRSVHPGLWTDEAFASLSDAAQILFIGLWTEADDKGIFEWKPLTLRMRLRPAKDGDMTQLLSELVEAGCVRRYEIDGRQYGAIRNFRKFQRPKSPNDVWPITDDIRNYVALPPAIPPERPNHFPNASEPFPQSFGKVPADVGCRMEDEEKQQPSAKGFYGQL